MATLNKQPIAPVKGNNIAPNPNGMGGDYFNSTGKAVSVETRVICNRVVLVTTLPDNLEAGAYIALMSVMGEISRLAWVEEPTGLFGTRRLKQAVKKLIKFEKDGIDPVVVTVEKPKSTVVAEPDVPPAPVEPKPAAPWAAETQPMPAEPKSETTVYEAAPPVEPKVEPKPAPVPVEEVVVSVKPKVEPVPAPVEPKVEPEPTVEPQVQAEPTPVEPEPETPVVSKQSSGKMSLKDIANEDKVAKQKNKYKPGKNSRAQQLVESQRVMQQMKHAKA
jgi:hypothetical protein